jgi:anaerobic magnesium-protoporphyrin IX monomethyl ester cyclase
MKVALITSGQEVMGVEHLSAAVKQRGHEVRLFFDPQIFGGAMFIRVEYLKERMDLQSKIAAQILEWSPDLAGFSCMTHNYYWCLEIAQKIKAKNPSIKIIFGGIHPTSLPETVLTNECVDMVAMGESDISFPELLDRLENGDKQPEVGGICYRNNGDFIFNPVFPLENDLDTLPLADKEIYYEKVPAFRKYPYSIMASRGCPYACTYCCNDVLRRLYKGQQLVRTRSVDSVISELKMAKERYGIREVRFYDEVFPFKVEWLKEFTERYVLEIGLPFQITYHVKFASEEQMRLLKSAGCFQVVFGMQSASERIRHDVCNRTYSNAEVIQAIDICKRNDISIILEHIFGLPFETHIEQEEAVEFYRQLQPDIIFTYWLTYYPETSIIQHGLDAGLLQENDLPNIREGRGSYYQVGTAIRDRPVLLVYQTLLDLIPLLPVGMHRWISHQTWLRRLMPRGYLVHAGLLFMAGIKLGRNEYTKYIQVAFSKKNVP